MEDGSVSMISRQLVRMKRLRSKSISAYVLLIFAYVTGAKRLNAVVY